MKKIYIKRNLMMTKGRQGFYCSQVFEIGNEPIKYASKPLLRMNEPIYILEKQEVAIPNGNYPIVKDFIGKFQWAKLLNIPNKKNIEFHIGNRLNDTEGCLLLGVGFNENRLYEDSDLIILDSRNTCNFFINDFLLNDEKNKQTKKVNQDEVIGYLTIA